MKNRTYIAFVSVLLAISLCACSAAAPAEAKGLYEHGLDLVAIIDEMLENEGFIKTFTASEEITDLLKNTNSGKYAEPSAVYSIEFPEEKLSMIVSSGEKYSDELEALMRNRGLLSLFTQINAQAGVEALAASSVCTAGKTFVSDECSSAVTYLYVFEENAPIAVTFTPGEGNSVSASAYLILSEQFDCSSSQSVANFLAELSPTVKSVKLG